MEALRVANPGDSAVNNDRCVKDLGRHDDSTLLDLVMGESKVSYTKQIVSGADHSKVEATQQIHVNKFWGGAGAAGWAQTQFELDGKTYNAEHKGIDPLFSKGAKQPINDPRSADYQTLMLAYKKISADFRDLPKCSIQGATVDK